MTKICAPSILRAKTLLPLYSMDKIQNLRPYFLILKGMSMLSLFIDGDIPLIFLQDTNKKMLEKLNQLRFWSAVLTIT